MSCFIDSTDEVINDLGTFINVRRKEIPKKLSSLLPIPISSFTKEPNHLLQLGIIYIYYLQEIGWKTSLCTM